MTSQDLKPTIRTFTGKTLDFSAPDPASIDLQDIAQGLSNCCRFACQPREFYSVAEHVVLVLDVVAHLADQDGVRLDRDTRRWALLHDAAEAYMGDMNAPLKQNLLPDYRAVEKRVMAAVVVAFGLPPDEPPIVKRADLVARAFEGAQFMPGRPAEYGEIPRDNEALTHTVRMRHLTGWAPRAARKRFLLAWEQVNPTPSGFVQVPG